MLSYDLIFMHAIFWVNTRDTAGADDISRFSLGTSFLR